MTNDDSLSREQLLKGVVSAGLIGIGFFSGSALPGLVRAIAGGLGGNWLSNLAEEAFADYCKRRFKTDGALNHDLRGALGSNSKRNGRRPMRIRSLSSAMPFMPT